MGGNWTKGASQSKRNSPKKTQGALKELKDGQAGVGRRGSRHGGGGGGGEQFLEEVDISKIKSKTSFNVIYGLG